MRSFFKKHFDLICFLIGITYCITLVIGGDIIALLIGQPDSVWTPINSPQYRVGDNYYYGAWVAEVVQHGFPPYSPSASEYQGKPLLETLRWFPLAIAAIPGIFFSDFRYVYIFDYVITTFLYFSIPFYLSRRLTGSLFGSILIGIAVLFLVQVWWIDIPITFENPSISSLLLWIKRLLSSPYDGSITSINMYEYEAAQGSFRYINLSISGPLLILYILLCHLTYANHKPSYIITTLLLLMTPLMAFSYPSHAMIAYASLCGYMVISYLRGYRSAAITLLGIITLSAAILVASGYIVYVQSVFAENELWNNIFNNEKLELIHRPILLILLFAFINKYTITFAIALFLSWKNRELRDAVTVFGVLSSVLSLVVLFDMPQLWGRFLGRGIDHLWFTFFLISCLYGYLQLPRNIFSMGLFTSCTILVISIPALSFGYYDIKVSHNGTRFMPESRWNALQAINANVKDGETVAALNWDDITFIPIYTRANLMVDNMIIGGRSPTIEMKRYISLWKILGYTRESLKIRISKSIESASERFASSREKLLSPPLLSEETYASGQIAEALIYWPYVKKFNGINVEENNRTSNELIEWSLQQYDSIDPVNAFKDFPFSYVIISGDEHNFEMHPYVHLSIIFSNQSHTILKVQQ